MRLWLRRYWRWLLPRLVGPRCEDCGEWLRGPNTLAVHREREHAGDPETQVRLLLRRTTASTLAALEATRPPHMSQAQWLEVLKRALDDPLRPGGLG